MLCLSSASQLGGVSFIKDECVFGKNEGKSQLCHPRTVNREENYPPDTTLINILLKHNYKQ